MGTETAPTDRIAKSATDHSGRFCEKMPTLSPTPTPASTRVMASIRTRAPSSAYVSAPATITGFYLIDSALAGDGAAFVSSARQLILPALTLALFVMAPVARMTRASMLGVLSADFVRTARAMGLSRTRVLYGYAFQNALLPVLTTIGMVFSFMLGANVLVEKVFAWPGIGSFAVESLVASDYAPVQGFVLTMAILYVALNLAIDLLYLAIDPRVTVEG